MATKQDHHELEAHLDEKLDALQARLDGKLDAVEARLGDQVRAAIHDCESRILKAIYAYTETMATRQDGTSKKISEFEERLMILERRILEAERRLNLPPAA